MQVDFDSLGTYLRQERERQQVALQDVAESTKIQRKFLEALEHDAYDQLPAEPFVMGFLRAYAQYMALDPAMVLAAYRSLHRHAGATEILPIPPPCPRPPPHDARSAAVGSWPWCPSSRLALSGTRYGAVNSPHRRSRPSPQRYRSQGLTRRVSPMRGHQSPLSPRYYADRRQRRPLNPLGGQSCARASPLRGSPRPRHFLPPSTRRRRLRLRAHCSWKRKRRAIPGWGLKLMGGNASTCCSRQGRAHNGRPRSVSG